MKTDISHEDIGCDSSSEEEVPDLHPMLSSNGVQTKITNKSSLVPASTLDAVSAISRKNSHKRQDNSTSDVATLMHLLRANIGIGLLTMPNAIQDAGYVVGPIFLAITGLLACHCMTILVRCSHALCDQLGVSSLDYADVGELALVYKLGLKRTSLLARHVINLLLVTAQLGICCTYFLFLAENTGRLILVAGGPYISNNTLILYFLPVLILLSFIRSLKALAPFSAVANLCYLYGSLTFVLFCAITILRRQAVAEDARPVASTGYTYALFFGNILFAFEGIGGVLPIENKIAKPRHFSPLLWTTISLVTLFFVVVGLSGYLAFGSQLKPVISLDFPIRLTSAYELAYPIAILYLVIGTMGSFLVQFYVPMDILEPLFLRKIRSSWVRLFTQLAFRMSIVVVTAGIPIIISNLNLLIDLIGAGSSSFLSLTIPALLEMIVFSKQKRYGLPYKVWVFKDLFIFAFGFIGAVFGTGLTIYKIVVPDSN